MSENRLSPKSHVFFIIFLIELVVSAIAPYVLGPFEVTYNSAIAAADHAGQWEVTVPGKSGRGHKNLHSMPCSNPVFIFFEPGFV